MNSINPLVSVILPVYNAEPYLREAMESILSQSYSNFEFIIINDGSTDSSEETILSFSDPRIKYHKQENIGLGATLNVALKLCTGKYIARQDQDDISHKSRFAKQVEFLEKSPGTVLLGTWAKIFKDNSTDVKFHKHAPFPYNLQFDLMFDNPFVHSSVMFRKETIEKVGFYNTDRSLYEDYDLWSRFLLVGDLANLPEVLLDYRHHDKGLSKNLSNFKDFALYNQGLKNIENLLGYVTKPIEDLEALYHWKKEKYSGATVKELYAALHLISSKIVANYPAYQSEIIKREKQYRKIIRYRLNILARRENPHFFKLLLLKIENKLLGLHPAVINE